MHAKSKQKLINHLYFISKEYNLPNNLLIAIVLIETKARPKYARIVEYLLLLFAFFKNIIFKYPIKNYTIGKCQLGLARILNFYGGDFYQYSKYIYHISFKQLIILYKVAFTFIQYNLLAKFLSEIYINASIIYSDFEEDSFQKKIYYVGEQFNGSFTYALRLMEVLKSVS